MTCLIVCHSRNTKIGVPYIHYNKNITIRAKIYTISNLLSNNMWRVNINWNKMDLYISLLKVNTAKLAMSVQKYFIYPISALGLSLGSYLYCPKIMNDAKLEKHPSTYSPTYGNSAILDWLSMKWFKNDPVFDSSINCFSFLLLL